MSSWPYALYSDATSTKIAKHDLTLNPTHPRRGAATTITHSTEYNETASAEKYENLTKLRKVQSELSTKPSSSPIISPKKKETPKQYNMAAHFTFEPEFEEIIIGEPLNRPRLNVYPLINEEFVHSDNTIHYSGKTPFDNNQHNLPLRYTQPITNKDEYGSIVRTTLNQRLYDHDNKNSKLLVERRPSDKHVESSGKTSFSSRAGPGHPAPTKHSKMNKHDDLIESEPNYTSQDMLSFSQPPLRTLKGSSPKSSTSQSRIPKTHAREQRLDRPMPGESRFQVTIDKQTQNNQLSSTLAAECVTQLPPAPKQKQEARSKKTLGTGSVGLISPSRKHNDKNNSKQLPSS
ncbi:unnamed protein product [Rotaria sp. Silwood1]|nr:unnamed protein product [Rotaria sp. Silwood1]